MNHKYVVTALILMQSLTMNVFAQSETSRAGDVKAEIQAKLRELPDSEREAFRDNFRQLLEQAEQQNLIHKMSDGKLDEKIRVMACVQAQGGIFLVAGQGLKCVNSDGDTFTMESAGAFELSFGVSGGLATGYHYGPARSGYHAVELGAGLHILVGGSVLMTGPYRILNGGVGAGIQLKYGVPRDSLFGGQIRVSVDK